MTRGFLLVALFVSSAGVANAQMTIRESIFGGCDSVIVAKMEKATPAGVLYTLPPTYSTLLEFTVQDVVWGPFLKGRTVKAYHSAKQDKQPTFTPGTKSLVG